VEAPAVVAGAKISGLKHRDVALGSLLECAMFDEGDGELYLSEATTMAYHP
jgi:hypothetical protein